MISVIVIVVINVLLLPFVNLFAKFIYIYIIVIVDVIVVINVLLLPFVNLFAKFIYIFDTPSLTIDLF